MSLSGAKIAVSSQTPYQHRKCFFKRTRKGKRRALLNNLYHLSVSPSRSVCSSFFLTLTLVSFSDCIPSYRSILISACLYICSLDTVSSLSPFTSGIFLLLFLTARLLSPTPYCLTLLVTAKLIVTTTVHSPGNRWWRLCWVMVFPYVYSITQHNRHHLFSGEWTVIVTVSFAATSKVRQ